MILVAVYSKGAYYKHNVISSTSPYVQKAHELSRHASESDAKFLRQSHKRQEQHGYAVALGYSGQQVAGIQAMVSLQCWVSSFNLPMRILEPIMSNTMFVSVPRHPDNTFLAFSDLFDIRHFNRISESLGYALVGTREEFFSEAPRNVIFVKSGPKNEPTKVVWTAESNADGEQNCYTFQDGRLVHFAEEQSLCFVRIIQAPTTLSRIFMTDKEVREIIFGDYLPQHVTLIFSKWQTPWYVENEELENPEQCRRFGKNSNKEQFLPSPRLLTDAEYYETHFLNSSTEVALMLRIERMQQFLEIHRHSKEWTADQCLDEAVKLTKEIRTSGYPMITLDLGTFGSASLSKFLGEDESALTEKSKSLLAELYDNKMTFEEWEESFIKASAGVEHSGYIAALQRTLASRAKCLILVGGGSFQNLALEDYLKNHQDPEDQCIHIVCALNERELLSIIDVYNDANN